MFSMFSLPDTIKNGMNFQIERTKTQEEDNIQKLLWLFSKDPMFIYNITLCLFTVFVNPPF